MTMQVLGNTEVSLLDVLDRLLDKGVVVGGDMTISVAEVDLIFASLRLVVTSVDKICENNTGSFSGEELPRPPGDDREYPQNEVCGLSPTYASAEPDTGVENINPDKAANGLAQLVLTVTDLLRNLLEREALRRMERGTLTHRQMERLGKAFLRLEKKMQDIKDIFNLQDEDLNLNFGSSGKLM